MRGLRFFHSTAKRVLEAGCVGLSCLFAIVLMACGGGTPPTESRASGSTDTAAYAFASVSAGGGHTCGVRRDGSVECWGFDLSGQATPPSGEFASVSGGGGHTCGVRRDGSVECWGSNENSDGHEVGQATPPDGVTTTETSTAIYGVHGNLNAKCEEIQAFGIDLRGQTGAEQTWQIIVAPSGRLRTWPYPVDTYAVDLKVLSSSQVAGA